RRLLAHETDGARRGRGGRFGGAGRRGGRGGGGHARDAIEIVAPGRVDRVPVEPVLLEQLEGEGVVPAEVRDEGVDEGIGRCFRHNRADCTSTRWTPPAPGPRAGTGDERPGRARPGRPGGDGAVPAEAAVALDRAPDGRRAARDRR